MAGIGNLLGLAKDALGAQSFALNVTGQNVANANTPGYVRRDAILETQIAGTVTYGGVVATGISRASDQYLDARANSASSLASSAQAHDDALGSVETFFNDAAQSGLAPSISALFSSFSALSASPSDPTARAQVLSSADGFATRMRQTSDGLNTLRQDLLSQATGTVNVVNSDAKQIANLNKQIALAENAGSDASDLKDQRDKIVSDLSQNVDVHSFTDGSGKFVIVSSGTTLVEGDNAASFSVTTATDGSIKLMAQRASGPPIDVSAQLTGGKLAGIRDARDVDTVAIGQKLDQLAYDVATAVNTVHEAGYGLDGANGRPLFSVGGPAGAAATIALDPSMVGQPDRVAAGGTAISGPADATNAVALASLATQTIAGGGTRTAAEAYSDLVGDVGQRKASSAQSVVVRNAMNSQATAMRDSTSGVSMDDEMVNLSRYQRAYEAASKLMQTADQLLADLIQNL